jgi:hypothetical protein
MLPAARKGGIWGHPDTHARCALAARDHPLERDLNLGWPTGWDNDDGWRRGHPITWSSWGCIEAHWWQYQPPWGCTGWWKFTHTRYCDGVRASTVLQAPLLGHIVIFHNHPCPHPKDDP